MGRWIKIFHDNTIEEGKDTDIASGISSWTRGKLVGIIEVFISEGRHALTLDVPNTEWHQFDRYEMDFATGVSSRQGRYLQAKVTANHIGCYLTSNSDSNYTTWVKVSKKPVEHETIIELTNDHVGKWITVRISTRNTPHLFISERGKYKGEQLPK